MKFLVMSIVVLLLGLLALVVWAFAAIVRLWPQNEQPALDENALYGQDRGQ